MKERGWYVVRRATPTDFFDMFEKEGEDDIDGYMENESPPISNLDGNYKTDAMTPFYG